MIGGEIGDARAAEGEKKSRDEPGESLSTRKRTTHRGVVAQSGPDPAPTVIPSPAASDQVAPPPPPSLPSWRSATTQHFRTEPSVAVLWIPSCKLFQLSTVCKASGDGQNGARFLILGICVCMCVSLRFCVWVGDVGPGRCAADAGRCPFCPSARHGERAEGMILSTRWVAEMRVCFGTRAGAASARARRGRLRVAPVTTASSVMTKRVCQPPTADVEGGAWTMTIPLVRRVRNALGHAAVEWCRRRGSSREGDRADLPTAVGDGTYGFPRCHHAMGSRHRSLKSSAAALRSGRAFP